MIVSFEGLAVTNELRSLLRDYYVGNVILGPENFYGTLNSCLSAYAMVFWVSLIYSIDAAQTARLTRDLQGIAQSADHAWPLLLGVEQQGGLVGHTFPFRCAIQYRSGTVARTLLHMHYVLRSIPMKLKLHKDDLAKFTSHSRARSRNTFEPMLAAIRGSQCEYLIGERQLRH